MRRRTFAAALPALMFATRAVGQMRVVDAAPPPDVAGLPATVPMELADGAPVIAATIDGQGPFRLLLDTGAPGPLRLTPAAVQRLALPVAYERRARTPGGEERTVSVLAVRSLAIGGASLGAVTAVERPAPLPIDGVVGATFFETCTLAIDYASRTVTMDRTSLPAAGPGIVPFVGGGLAPTIPLRVGDVAVEVHVDTGNARAALILSRDDAARLATRGDARAIGIGRSPMGTVEMFATDLAAPVTVGGVPLAIDAVSWPAMLPPGNVGSAAFAGRVLTIDGPNRRLRVAVA